MSGTYKLTPNQIKDLRAPSDNPNLKKTQIRYNV